MGEANASSGTTGAGGQGDLKNKATEVGQNLRDLGSQVRDVARDKYDELREQAGNYYSQGRERAQEWEQSLESYVQEKPIQAVLMAAGIGVLLGLLWKRS
jgi:ElaB/YqjD/DUF883 family membrane-anchored ribosome-binding protein